MKFKVEGCTCCGFCACIWPEWFYMGSDGFAHARDAELPPERMDEIKNCVNQCAGRAISVTGGLPGEGSGK